MIKADRDNLILKYIPLVHHIAGRVRIPERVPLKREDLISAGIESLVQSAGKYDPAVGANFMTFIWPYVRFAMMDLIRKCLRERHSSNTICDDLDRYDVTPCGLPLPEEAADKKDQLDRIRTAIKTLRPREQEVLDLCVFRELSQVRAAAELGVSKARISQVYTAAVFRLKALCGDADEPARTPDRQLPLAASPVKLVE